MAFLMPILQFFLKTFLSGLFGQLMQQVEDEAKAKEDAAKLQVQTTEEAAATEVKIAQDQAQLQVQAAQNANKPKPPDDPFNNDAWNGSGT